MIRRWIVIYYNGDETKAAMIDDDTSDGSVSMPFGVEPSKVADDCEDITAIIEVCDNTDIPMVVIDDLQFNLDPADPDVIAEEVPDEDEERICGQCSTVVPAATVDADGDCEDCAALKVDEAE